MIRIGANKKDIVIPRGDTGLFIVHVVGQDLAELDTAIFAVVNNDGETLLIKNLSVVDNSITVRFESDDTSSMPIGQYRWDIRFKLSTGEVHSVFALDIMPKFRVVEVAADV